MRFTLKGWSKSLQWHVVFAWYPVHVGGGQWVWIEPVWRRRNFVNGKNCEILVWEFRSLD